MIHLLLTEPAFAKLEPRLHALGDRLACVTMDGMGRPRIDGRSVAVEDAAVRCAFISNDLFIDRTLPQFTELLVRSSALEWAQSAGAGLDHPTFAMLARRGVRLTTCHDQASGMADYVLWGVLNHFQYGRARISEQAARRWTRLLSRDLQGTRWLIVGFGAVGQAVARRAKAFGAHVTGIRRSAGPSPLADVTATPDEMFGHLEDADVVVLCMPLTPETAGLVDANFLSVMKTGAMLVNVGRGGSIDEDALLTALDAGRVGHALLDVFQTEPLPSDSRFWWHPRVTLTAHCSGSTTGLSARIDDLFLDNLERFMTGEPLVNEVAASEVAGRTPHEKPR